MRSGNLVRQLVFGIVRQRLAVGVTCGCLAMMAGACAKKPAQAQPTQPTGLVVPVIPQRVFAPLPEAPIEEPLPPEPEEPRPAASRPARPRPRPDRQAETRPADPSKPEPVPAEATPVVTAPPPTLPLRTPQIADDTETGRRVRATIGRAGAELTKVNTATLSSDARMQYETARRFVDQAEGALNARNYMFAAYLADKAEALAKGLVGR